MGHASTNLDLGAQNIRLPAFALGLRKAAIAVAVIGLGGGAAIGYTGAFGTDAHHSSVVRNSIMHRKASSSVLFRVNDDIRCNNTSA